MADSGNTTTGADADDEASRPARMAFLAVIMVGACVGNILLLYAVLHSRKLRRSVQNIVIVNLAAVGVCDCFLNMALVMGSLATADWSFGDVLCRWHSFAMNLVLVETILLLTVLVTDRFLAVKFVQKYEFLISPVRLALVIIYTWVQSLAFSIPFLFDVVYTTFRPKLHTCSVSNQTPLTFIGIASVLCFLAPVIAIAVIFVLIFCLAHKQRHEVKTLKARNHYTDIVMEEPRLSQEMLTVKMMCVLFVLWFVLEFPYIITTYIQQYRYSHQLSFSVEYSWAVDIAFIWMRFFYCAIFPCVVFYWKRGLWSAVKEFVMCRKHNSVVDMEINVKELSKPAAVREATVPPSAQLRPRERDKADPPSMLSFNVPVLFATSDGMHIETPHATDPELFYTEILSRTQFGEIPVLMGRQLDVGDPDTEGMPFPHDTTDASDYDSSSGCSQQASPAWARCTDTQHQWDIHHNKAKFSEPSQDQQNSKNDLSETRGVDSGLELSGSGGYSTGKSIQKMVEISRKKVTESHQTDSETNQISRSASKDKHKGAFRFDQRMDGHKEADESPPILSPSVDVIPVWYTPEPSPQDQELGESVSSESNQTDQNTRRNLPKASGRLKPLTADRKRKGKKAGLSKKKKIFNEGTADAQPSGEGAENGTVPCEATGDYQKYSKNDHQKADSESSGQNINQYSTKSSRGGRGHKRTKTSDSQKSLLGSNSSLELQNMKTQNQKLNDQL